MEEEVDIIEILKRVKEGKAPKKIKINKNVYKLCDDDDNIQFMYRRKFEGIFGMEQGWYDENITLDTKIKILPDKPTIEKLEEKICGISLPDTNLTLLKAIKKINEITDYINKEEQ